MFFFFIENFFVEVFIVFIFYWEVNKVDDMIKNVIVFVIF